MFDQVRVSESHLQVTYSFSSLPIQLVVCRLNRSPTRVPDVYNVQVSVRTRYNLSDLVRDLSDQNAPHRPTTPKPTGSHTSLPGRGNLSTDTSPSDTDETSTTRPEKRWNSVYGVTDQGRGPSRDPVGV